MDRGRAAAALLALATCIACSVAAPTTADTQALDLYKEPTEGCYYNFQHYREGDRIMTNEPCLNCTCHNKMLMCYLKVCPFTKAIGQDCTVAKRADQCCPIVTCPDVPVDLLTSTSTTSPAEYGETGVVKADKYGCTIDGKYLPEGAKVPPMPNKPCEHCYCIRNMTTCVMQECTLHVDGCTPIYHKDVCCPVRYVCDHPEDEIPLLDDMTTTVRPTPGFILTTTTEVPATELESKKQCVKNDQVYQDGARLETENPCEHCFCMKGDVVCVVQECGMPVEHEGKSCTALPPRKGQCCPDRYICDGDEFTTDATAETPFDDLNTVLPPKRIVEEGSGYRKESDDISTFETEGSGDEPEIHKTTQLFMNEINTITETVANKITEKIDKLTTLTLPSYETTAINRYPYKEDEEFTTSTKSSIQDGEFKPTEKVIKQDTSPTYSSTDHFTEATVQEKTTNEIEKQNTSFEVAQVTTESSIQETTLLTEIEKMSQSTPTLEQDITEQSIITTEKLQKETLQPRPTSFEKEHSSTSQTIIVDYTTQGSPKIEPETTISIVAEAVTTQEPTDLLTGHTREDESEFEASTQALHTHKEKEFEILKTTTIRPEEITQHSTDLPITAETEKEDRLSYTTENDLKAVNESTFIDDRRTTSAIPDVFKDTSAFELSTSELPTKDESIDISTSTEEPIPLSTKSEIEITTSIINKPAIPDIPNPEENDISPPGRIPGEGDCLLNGIHYKNDTIVPNTNKCHSSCKCISSIISCDPIICSMPPSYMDNCTAMYDTPDSCCPTFVCDQSKETVPPQPHSQMQGTESSVSSPSIECRGNECEVNEQQSSTIPAELSPACNNKEDCQDTKKQEKPLCEGLECEEGSIPETPVIACETEECKQTTVLDTVEPSCEGDNCLNLGISAPTCVGGICTNKTLLESPTSECDDEHCKETPIPEISDCTGEMCKALVEPETSCEQGKCNASDVPEGSLCKGIDCKVNVIPEKEPSCEGEGCSSNKLPEVEPSCEGNICREPQVTEKLTPVCKGGECISTELPEIKPNCEGELCNKAGIPDMSITTCEGEACKTIKLPEEHSSCEGDLCKKSQVPEISVPVCEGEACTQLVEDVTNQCADGICKTKETPQSEEEKPTDAVVYVQKDKSPLETITTISGQQTESVEFTTELNDRSTSNVVYVSVYDEKIATSTEEPYTNKPPKPTYLEEEISTKPTKEFVTSKFPQEIEDSEVLLLATTESAITTEEKIKETEENLSTESSLKTEPPQSATTGTEQQNEVSETTVSLKPDQNIQETESSTEDIGVKATLSTLSEITKKSEQDQEISTKSMTQPEQDEMFTKAPDITSTVLQNISSDSEINISKVAENKSTETPSEYSTRKSDYDTSSFVEHEQTSRPFLDTDEKVQDMTTEAEPTKHESTTTKTSEEHVDSTSMPISLDDKLTTFENDLTTQKSEPEVTQEIELKTTQQIENVETYSQHYGQDFTTEKTTQNSLNEYSEQIVSDTNTKYTKEPQESETSTVGYTKPAHPSLSLVTDVDQSTEDKSYSDTDSTTSRTYYVSLSSTPFQTRSPTEELGSKIETTISPTSLSVETKSTSFKTEETTTSGLSSESTTVQESHEKEISKTTEKMQTEYKPATEILPVKFGEVENDADSVTTLPSEQESSEEPQAITLSPDDIKTEVLLIVTSEASSLFEEPIDLKTEEPIKLASIEPTLSEEFIDVTTQEPFKLPSVEPSSSVTPVDIATKEPVKLTSLEPTSSVEPVNIVTEESSFTSLKPSSTEEPLSSGKPVDIATEESLTSVETTSSVESVDVETEEPLILAPVEPSPSKEQVDIATEEPIILTSVSPFASVESVDVETEEPLKSATLEPSSSVELVDIATEEPIKLTSVALPAPGESVNVETETEEPSKLITVQTSSPEEPFDIATEKPAKLPSIEPAYIATTEPLDGLTFVEPSATLKPFDIKTEVPIKLTPVESSSSEDSVDNATEETLKSTSMKPSSLGEPVGIAAEEPLEFPPRESSSSVEPTEESPKLTSIKPEPTSKDVFTEKAETPALTETITEKTTQATQDKIKQPTSSPVTESTEDFMQTTVETEKFDQNIADMHDKSTQSPISIIEITEMNTEAGKDKATEAPAVSGPTESQEITSPGQEYSATTPYLVELEEHPHYIDELPSTTAEHEEPTSSLSPEILSSLPTDNIDVNKQQTDMSTDDSVKETIKGSTEPYTTADTKLQPDKLEIETEKPTVTTQTVPLQEETSPSIQQTESSLTTEGIKEQPEKEIPTTSKAPEVTGPEEEFILAKVTTPAAEEVSTQIPISDKIPTKPSVKPIPGTTKPSFSDFPPSDEISPPEDENQFPPSGGYGQEPDYGDEDQAFGPGTCRYGGKIYVSAQQIPRDDPCDFCFCFRSDIICLQQSCPPPIHGCHEEPIQGFCCPRYECPVSMAMTLNVTTTTTTTTTTLPPHFLPHAYKGAAQRRGCHIKGHTYKVGEVVRASSGPCLHCTCGGDGQMKCDPKVCTPEPMLRQMIAAAVSAKRRR